MESSTSETNSDTSVQAPQQRSRRKSDQKRHTSVTSPPRSSHRRKRKEKSRAPNPTIQYDDEQLTISATSALGSELESQSMQIAKTISSSSLPAEGTLPERMGTKGNPARSREISESHSCIAFKLLTKLGRI